MLTRFPLRNEVDEHDQYSVIYVALAAAQDKRHLREPQHSRAPYVACDLHCELEADGEDRDGCSSDDSHDREQSSHVILLCCVDGP